LGGFWGHSSPRGFTCSKVPPMSFVRALSFAVSLLAAAGLWIMVAGTGGLAFLPLSLFLAAVGLFALRPLRKALGSDALCLAPCLPALSPFVQGGAAGFALVAFLAGFGVLLSGPCLDALPPRRTSGRGRRAFGRRNRRLSLARWLVSSALLVSYGGVAFFSPLSVAFCLIALALFLLVYALSLWASGERIAGGRRRFAPVRIISRDVFEFGFVWAMLPFSLAALALALMGFAPPVERDALPGLFAALSPLPFVLPALVLWAGAGKRGERTEATGSFFSRDGE